MGLVASMDMVDNMMLKTYKENKGPLVDRKTPRALAEKLIEELEIVTPGVSTPVRKLSGGNVQKVLVGREIASSPTVLMTAYPVRGLDINSSYTIYRLGRAAGAVRPDCGAVWRTGHRRGGRPHRHQGPGGSAHDPVGKGG